MYASKMNDRGQMEQVAMFGDFDPVGGGVYNFTPYLMTLHNSDSITYPYTYTINGFPVPATAEYTLSGNGTASQPLRVEKEKEQEHKKDPTAEALNQIEKNPPALCVRTGRKDPSELTEEELYNQIIDRASRLKAMALTRKKRSPYRDTKKLKETTEGLAIAVTEIASLKGEIKKLKEEKKDWEATEGSLTRQVGKRGIKIQALQRDLVNNRASMNTVIRDLREDVKKLEEHKGGPLPTCVVCLDRSPAVAFVHCGHYVCCQECSTRLAKCPICRDDIERALFIYKAE